MGYGGARVTTPRIFPLGRPRSRILIIRITYHHTETNFESDQRVRNRTNLQCPASL